MLVFWLILTKETEKGGDLINDARKKNNLELMEMVVIDMVMGNDQSKVSSTNIIALSFNLYHSKGKSKTSLP